MMREEEMNKISDTKNGTKYGNCGRTGFLKFGSRKLKGDEIK